MAGCVIYVRWEGGLIPCEVGPDDTIDDLRRQLPSELEKRPMLNAGEVIPNGTTLADAGVGSESVLELAGSHALKWDPEWSGEWVNVEEDGKTARFERKEPCEDQATLYARLLPPAKRTEGAVVSATITAHSGDLSFPQFSYRVGFGNADSSNDSGSALGNDSGAFGLLAHGSLYDQYGAVTSGGDSTFAGVQPPSIDNGDKVKVWLDSAAGEFKAQVNEDEAVVLCNWTPNDDELYLTVCTYDKSITHVTVEPVSRV
eukprot:Hpha_TRINITY_DN28555_c0_g1::TRINITY_DN28555_c0_g1_i1::g.18537::m.18537